MRCVDRLHDGGVVLAPLVRKLLHQPINLLRLTCNSNNSNILTPLDKPHQMHASCDRFTWSGEQTGHSKRTTPRSKAIDCAKKGVDRCYHGLFMIREAIIVALRIQVGVGNLGV